MIQVTPSEYTTTDIVTSFSIFIISLNLGLDATFLVKAFNDQEVQIFEKHVTITGEEYLNWGSNDSYIINLLASKVGLTVN